MKYLLGTIFSIGMSVVAIMKRKQYGLVSSIMTAITCVIAAILFFGQFIARM